MSERARGSRCVQVPVPCQCACWCECECTCGKACGLARAVGGACECAVRLSARASAREVCGLARAEQRRVLIPHGVKRHHLGIGGVHGRSLRRVVVWRAASPITPRARAMLGTCEIGATGPHSIQKIRLVYFGNTILATVSLINCCGPRKSSQACCKIRPRTKTKKGLGFFGYYSSFFLLLLLLVVS